MLLWSIWKSRNELVWSNETFSATGVQRVATSLLSSWRVAHEEGNSLVYSRARHEDLKWKRPGINQVKINVDAAHNPRDGLWSWGWVSRNSDGIFIQARTRVVKAKWSPEVAEAWGVWEAIRWACRNWWTNLVIETDASLIIAGIQGESYAAQIGVIYDDIKVLLRANSDIQVKWCRRVANKVAHTFARYASYASVSDITFDLPPNYVVSHLANDLIL
ncbi:unnamed protein product [Cuscuta europaea]|uniref:RNase H type-1 domain-containing protein n=1 Tax=Cuscuta europaea TaxID=41803 RepID=A0A9P0YJU4_CUSEU|nr:unnamed protein product [Cuscuta europaea]